MLIIVIKKRNSAVHWLEQGVFSILTRMATLAANPQAAIKVQRSKEAIASFLRKQHEWLEHAKTAFKEHYYLEALTVCKEQMHSLLRRGLWLEAQLHSLAERPAAWDDGYLFDLLLRSSHD